MAGKHVGETVGACCPFSEGVEFSQEHMMTSFFIAEGGGKVYKAGNSPQ